MMSDDDEPTEVSSPGGGRGLLDQTGITKKAMRRPAPSLDGSAKPEATRLIRPGQTGGGRGPAKAVGKLAPDEVAGWLVVIDGPGRGADFRLGYGITRVGLGKDTDISLEFGDDSISRGVLLRVTSDPRSRKFFVQQDGGKNVVYLNGDPLLIPTEVRTGEHITIGETTLFFVAFSPDFFDWTADAAPA